MEFRDTYDGFLCWMLLGWEPQKIPLAFIEVGHNFNFAGPERFLVLISEGD